MFNELLFLGESFVVSLFALGSLLFGSAGLCSFVSLCWVIGNVFVLKEVTILGLSIITTDVFAVGCDLGITLLREYYGEKQAKQAIMLGMYSALFFVIISKFLLWFEPSACDTSHEHFFALLQGTPRIMLSSIGVAFITKFFNLMLLNFFTKLWGNGRLKLKAILSLCISQFFDTVIFTFAALYGTVESVWAVIGFSYVVKCISIFICVPFVITLYTLIRKRWGI
jgi:hypothetical protein